MGLCRFLFAPPEPVGEAIDGVRSLSCTTYLSEQNVSPAQHEARHVDGTAGGSAINLE